ncbi:MAG: MBOAT family protein, partial [Clostridia bacterium]|nr:MBOAT family protein [Clostridia bacterium]
GAFDWISSLILLAILAVASTPYPRKLLYKIWEKHDAPVRAVTAILSLLVFFVAVAYLVNSSYNPFLYYRF